MMKQFGFTLIELILYIAIVTIVISALIPFGWAIIGSGAKSSTQQEVFSNARFISERIKYEIRNASGVNSVTASSISLANFNATLNRTIIDISGGKIRIKQGTNPTIDLNSADTTANSLTFTNYTSTDNKTKNIQFNFTLQSNFNQTRQEYQQTVTVQGDGEIRSN